ncbi:predicted protein, partial [Nematostella vectensis]
MTPPPSPHQYESGPPSSRSYCQGYPHPPSPHQYESGLPSSRSYCQGYPPP